ncbi:SDR family NAD(P)-dependent oxidoreductase [Aquipuribacter sp. SD81]|uniref:SDR family NAD(P)-dependent oxidoreductase n=1 Tax=Aquipuribacter sp. SD81 TaxID=3127703 RepID=UPI003018ED3E
MPTPAPTGAVLVTGCSSGIGRATALRLVRGGHQVHATARRPDTLAGLAAAGCTTGALDVTDDASAAAAVEDARRHHGRVRALVNNAGYGEYGPVEEVSLDAARAQLETNVIGVARLTRLVLPEMREAGDGRIVTVGSMGGRLTFPGGGWYHASKHALVALHDALRVEVAPFGVHVSLVEPGLIRTEFGATATRSLAAAGDGTGRSEPAAGTDERTPSPYAGLTAAVERGMSRSYAGPLAAGPDAVARAVERAVTAERPRSRYVVTPGARGLMALRRLGGDRVWDGFVRRLFGLP